MVTDLHTKEAKEAMALHASLVHDTEEKEGAGSCQVCGGDLVEHFLPGATGGLCDGYHCKSCGVRHAFIPPKETTLKRVLHKFML